MSAFVKTGETVTAFIVVKLKVRGGLKGLSEVFLRAEVRVTVMTSPGLKSVVGLNTTDVVPPPEKVPDTIPVYFPVITTLVAFKVEALIGASKVNVISESKDTVFVAVSGVEDVKVKV